jgi:hypothetical protein
MRCHYCQKLIAKGAKRKTQRIRLYNLETGKSMPFLGDWIFHIECFTQLGNDRKRLAEKSALKGIKVTL